MKIQLIMGGVDNSGGAEHVMCVLANTFAEMGHDIILSVLSVNSQPFYPLSDKVRYIQSGKVINIPVLRYFHKLLRLRKVMRKEKPDAIVSFITPMNCAAIVTAFGLRRKLYVSERIVPSHYDGTKIGKLRSLLYPLANGVVCQTNEAKEYFKDSKCYKNCTVIKNPLMTQIEIKTDYTAKGKICAVGRLTEQKNYPMMFEAFKSFAEQYPDYVLDVYGNGALKGELKKLIDDMGLTSNINLCGSVDNLGERLKAYDFFVMASDYEGMSNALAEAMSAGLPCLSTDYAGGGAADLIQDGLNGILVSVNDMGAFSNKMAEIASNEELRKRLGKEATNIRSKLSSERIAEQWIELFK